MSKIKKRIASIACAFTMILSSVIAGFPASVADKAAFPANAAAESGEAVLTKQSISLYPNGEEAEQIITLNGLMPEGATAEAVDVSELHEGVSAYDITITSGEQEYQPGAANPIRVEISDPVISDSVYIELWHIADDGTRERITEFSVTDSTISFEATAFSVYEIVAAPEPLPDGTITAQTVEELDGQGFWISNKNGSNSYYFMNDIVDNFKIRKTAANASGNAAVWYFENTEGNKFRIYTLMGEEKVYMKMTTSGSQGNMSLVSEADATAFDVTLLTNNNVNGFYISYENRGLNMFGGANGNGFAGWNNSSGDGNSKMILTYPPVTADDPADLDGKSFALIMTKLDKPAALMADDCPGYPNRRKAVEATIRNNPFVNGTNIYQTPATDLTLWTFENISGSKYYVMTKVDGSYKYLRISGSSLTLADTPNADCELTVAPGTGNYSGMIQIKNSAGMAVNLKSKSITNGFQGYTAGNGANEWLSLAQLSVIKDDDFVTNIAKKISVSEIQDGQQVVVYTRVWDNTAKEYKHYIVDYEGNLIPAYEIGENLEWQGLKIGTVFWEFTEYQNADGSPNYYYELQNTYSGNYLAPQIVDGQIISPDTIGINLNGRKNDKYYSTILAWDETYYQYAGLKVDGDHIVSAPKSKADDFYFAVIEPPVSELTTVDTINNNDFGISMKMIDYGNGKLIGGNPRSQDQYDVITEDSYIAGPNPISGILEPWLDPVTGYPRVTEKGNSSSTAENPISLSRLFDGAYEVNNLFLKNTYNESGYFEYDCTNNFAYLDPVTHTFRVYDQVATVEAGNGVTRQHGQFLPYNDLDPSRLSEIKNQTDALGFSLPYDDPRRSKPLYSIPYKQNSLNGENGNADYFFGMELEAGFTQTVSGQDAWGHDMIFEFTGDDDFWLYIDDVLVIDLGGIHNALSGSVNFRTGEVLLRGRNNNNHVTIKTTNLKALFEESYRAKYPDATNAEVQAYLDRYFGYDQNGVQENIFKDYSNHKMKIFYMERGAGASNLHLRFNLAAVKPGQVRLSKEVSTDNSNLDLDYELVEYPFQIWYKLPSSANYTTLKPESAATDYVGVYYDKSQEPVSYLPSYTPPGGSTSYPNVFFLSAGESVFIDFPENIVDYYIVECGLDENVYDVVKVNGDPVAGTAAGTERKDYNCGTATVRDRPAVTYDNHVDSDSIRDLSFTKKLYDENNQEVHNDPTTYDFRLYLGAESATLANLAYANMHRYRVISPSGKYCSWSATSGFVETGYSSDEGLTQAQLEDITFFTSPNGSISKIPAWYKVQVIDLPIGTKFKVEEKFSEMPLGYDLIGFERDGGSYLVNANDPENTGIVRANSNPAMFVNNQRGFGISAEKVWADRYSADSHEPAYFALYKKNGSVETIVNGTLKQLKAPDTTVKWFLHASSGSLSDYVVREVKPVSDPVVDADGNVTSYSGTVIPVLEGTTDTVTIGVWKNGSDQMNDKDYSVSYNEGTVKSSVVGAALQNIRTDTVTNTPVSKGVRIRLSEWNGTAGDRDFKTALPDGTFTLKLNGDAVDFGEFTSDENGLIAVLYDYEKGENNIYTLTQTGAPVTWVGTDTPIRFYIEEVEGQDRVKILNPENDGWVNHKDISSDDLIGDIIIYNKKLSLNMIKYAAGSNEPLARAEFDLYRGTKQPDGSYLQNYYPISGYEALVSGADGVIPKIDETLPAGRYFLREKRSPNGYERFVDAIEFNISELGEVELVSAPIGVFLSSDTSQDGRVIIRIKAGNTRKDAQTANLIVMKKVEGAFGDKTKDFAFTLTVENAADEYFMWTLNEVTQEGIRSGDTFRLAHGDTVVFILPLECEVTIREEAEDYTASMQLNHAEAQNTDSITFPFSATTELLVTNTRSGILPTGISGTLCKALLLFIMPMMPVGLILYSKRKRKRTS